MKICLTGATGNLGQACCHFLSQAGYEIHATDQKYERNLPVASLRVANILDPDVVYELLEGMDALVHLANIPTLTGGKVQEVFNINSQINANIFAAAAALRLPRVIWTSSIHVVCSARRSFAHPSCLEYLPVDGNHPAHIGNFYGLSKSIGEQTLAMQCQDGDIATGFSIRFPYLMTDRQMRRKKRRGKRAIANGLNLEAAYKLKMRSFDELGLFLPVREAARVIEHCLKAEATGHHAIFPAMAETHEGWTVEEMRQARYADVPLRRPVDDSTGLADLDAVERLIGYRPPSFEQVLAAISQD